MGSKPNFFIVGAPKCGTTALYEYLRAHPAVFMPSLKEPHFFATDLITSPIINSLEEYMQLFAECTPEHLRVGEASASYLLSKFAGRSIREFDPDAKVIAMFRNPVEVVHSFHSMLLYYSEDTVSDFETAWRLQERRSRGIDVPSTCQEPFWLQYARIAQFGTYTERLLSTFPREQVKLILYDDFVASPRQVYESVIEFLDIPQDHRTEFPRINENKRAKVAWFRDFYRKPPRLLHHSFRGLKRTLGAGPLVALKDRIVNLNTVRERRSPLSPEFRAELRDAFRDEVALLSRLLDRDLSHWT